MTDQAWIGPYAQVFQPGDLDNVKTVVDNGRAISQIPVLSAAGDFEEGTFNQGQVKSPLENRDNYPFIEMGDIVAAFCYNHRVSTNYKSAISVFKVDNIDIEDNDDGTGVVTYSGAGIGKELQNKVLNIDMIATLYEGISPICNETYIQLATAHAQPTADHYNGAWIIIGGLYAECTSYDEVANRCYVDWSTDFLDSTNESYDMYFGVATNDIEQAVAFSQTLWLTSHSGTPNGSYIRVNARTPVELMNDIADQSGWRWYTELAPEPERKVFWFDSQDSTPVDSGVYLAAMSEFTQEGLESNRNNGPVISAKRKTKGKDNWTRAYVQSGDGVTLAEIDSGDVTIPTGFSVDFAKSLVVHTAEESGLITQEIVEKNYQFKNIVSAGNTTEARKATAINVFNATITKLRERTRKGKSYVVRTVLLRDIQIGQTLHLKYTKEVFGETLWHVDADLWIRRIAASAESDKGVRILEIELGHEFLDRDVSGNRAVAEAIQQAGGGATSGNVILTTGSAGPVQDHGDLQELLLDQHTQYLLASGARAVTGNMAVNAGVTIDGVDISDHATNAAAHHNPVVVLSSTPAGGLSVDAWQRLTLNLVGYGDHSALINLDKDDHPHYFLADGSRQLGGNLTFTGAKQISTTSGNLNITAAGWTGIKTALPEAPLHIRDIGSTVDNHLILHGDRNISDTEVGILFKDRNVISGGQNTSRIYSRRAGGTGNFNLYFQSGSQTTNDLQPNYLVLQGASGYLGLNILPTYPLHVNGGATNTIARFAATDELAQIQLVDTQATAYIGTDNGRAFIGMGPGQTATNLAISAAGYLGVGDATPEYPLKVVGETGLDGDLQLIGGSRKIYTVSGDITLQPVGNLKLDPTLKIQAYANMEFQQNSYITSTSGFIVMQPTGALYLRPSTDIVHVSNKINFEQRGTIQTAAGTGLTVSPSTDLLISPNNGEVLFDTNTILQGLGWVSGVAGKYWGIQTDEGKADFRHIYADELTVTLFSADETLVIAGSHWVSPGMGKLAAEFEIADVGVQRWMYFFDSDGLPATPIFKDDSWLMIRTTDTTGGGLYYALLWGQVKNYADLGDGTQRWIFTTRKLGAANVGQMIPQAAVAVGWGVEGDGVWGVTTNDPAGSPYAQIMTWTGDNPYDAENRHHHIRLGQLSGLGYGHQYGLYAGIDTRGPRIVISDVEAGIHDIPLSLYHNENDGGLLRIFSLNLNTNRQSNILVNGDITTEDTPKDVGRTGIASYYSHINENPEDGEDSSWLYNLPGHSSEIWFHLTDIQHNMTAMNIKIFAETLLFTDDNCSFMAQVFQDDMETPLTEEVKLFSNHMNKGLVERDFIDVDTAALDDDWAYARLRLRWVYQPRGETEVIRLEPSMTEGPYIAVGNPIPTAYWDEQTDVGFWVGKDPDDTSEQPYKVRIGGAELSDQPALTYSRFGLSLWAGTDKVNPVIRLNSDGTSWFSNTMTFVDPGKIVAGQTQLDRLGITLVPEPNLGSTPGDVFDSSSIKFTDGGTIDVGRLYSDIQLPQGGSGLNLVAYGTSSGPSYHHLDLLVDTEDQAPHGIRIGAERNGITKAKVDFLISNVSKVNLNYYNFEFDTDIVANEEVLLYKTLYVTGITTMADELTVHADVYANQELHVTNHTYLKNHVTVTGDALINGGIGAGNLTKIGGVAYGCLELNQGNNHYVQMQIQATDVEHSWNGYDRANTYLDVKKRVSWAGGAQINGYSENYEGLRLVGWAKNASTHEAGDSTAPTMVSNAINNVAPTGDQNAVVWQAGAQGVMILKGSGELWNTFAATMNTFDEEDDLALISAVALAIGGDNVLHSEWDDFVKYNADDLDRLNIVRKTGFVNRQNLDRLFVGTFRQINDKVSAIEAAYTDTINDLMSRIKKLEDMLHG